jgi:hypothetical protein
MTKIKIMAFVTMTAMVVIEDDILIANNNSMAYTIPTERSPLVGKVSTNFSCG